MTGHPALVPDEFAVWLEQRREQIDGAELVYVAHQLDLLGRVPAAPSSPPPGDAQASRLPPQRFGNRRRGRSLETWMVTPSRGATRTWRRGTTYSLRRKSTTRRRRYIAASCRRLTPPPRTLLELGSGGGCNAWHYKQHFTPTLVDLSPEMLAISQRINPDCEHLPGDMRTIRLGRQFDAVFVHDAVMYLTTEEDLRQAMTTAFVHCRPGGWRCCAGRRARDVRPAHRARRQRRRRPGAPLPAMDDRSRPDGHDVPGGLRVRAARGGQPPRCEHEQHEQGLFARADWLRLLAEVGFQASVHPLPLSDFPPGALEVFLALRPEG